MIRVLKDIRFWINYILILLFTCWVPLLSQTAIMKQSDGKEVSRTEISVRAYQSWWLLATHGPGAGHGRAVAIHAGLTFAIAFGVWSLAMRRRSDDTPANMEVTETNMEANDSPDTADSSER